MFLSKQSNSFFKLHTIAAALLTYTQHPIFLQLDGTSKIIIGVTSSIDKCILVCEPENPNFIQKLSKHRN